jgi:hypothetical protein
MQFQWCPFAAAAISELELIQPNTAQKTLLWVEVETVEAATLSVVSQVVLPLYSAYEDYS